MYLFDWLPHILELILHTSKQKKNSDMRPHSHQNHHHESKPQTQLAIHTEFLYDMPRILEDDDGSKDDTDATEAGEPPSPAACR